MRSTIAPTFAAAALLMLAGVWLELYGREDHGAGDVPAYLLKYRHPLLDSRAQAANVTWLLALGVLVGGIMFSAAGPPGRVSVLGLSAGAPRRLVRAAPRRFHGEDGLTRLERVIGGP